MKRHPWGIVAVALVAVAAICWADHVTGPEIGLSLFYLIPIVVSGWFGGTAAGVTVAVAAATAWLSADLAFRSGISVAISLWNGFTRVVIYVAAGAVTAYLHRDREKYRRLAALESGLARTDVTTGLLNSRGFMEAVAIAAATSHASGDPVSLVYFDLDNFKKFNDLFGHAAGDDILAEVGMILRDRAPRLAPAARIGGDEYAVVLAATDEASAMEWARDVVERIQRIGAAFPDIAFGASAGVATWTEAPQDPELLLRAADDAMYRAKEKGKGSVASALTT